MTRIKKVLKAAAFCSFSVFFTLALPTQVQAQPWAEVGDRTLRSDVEILAARGLISGLVTTWPIPAGQLRVLYNADLQQQPEYVRRAAERVLAHLKGPSGSQELTGVVDARVTNSPAVVRDFGTLARNQADVRVGADFDGGEELAVSLRVGEQARFSGEEKATAYDGSSVTGALDNIRWYGGWVDQWYGPGWDSSLILSNNARPFPKIGLMRDNPTAFETPWLSWLGPWQANFFVGLLDGPRIARNTAMGSLRLTFMPIHGLEIALTRMTEFCGKGHPCNPVSAAFHFRNDDAAVNETNDEATIELKGTINAGALIISPYLQMMNEDTGPFAHSDTSYLVGTSFAAPFGDRGAHWRVTTEFTDSVATVDAFDFSTVANGVAYNNYGYADGFRYRGRTLGFSLDSDSHLASLVGQFTDAGGWTYRAAYHLAKISTPQLAALQSMGSSYNTVSSQPVTINEGELGLSIPYRWFTVDFAVRAQDALPVAVQGSNGEKIAGEIGLVYKF